MRQSVQIPVADDPLLVDSEPASPSEEEPLLADSELELPTAELDDAPLEFFPCGLLVLPLSFGSPGVDDSDVLLATLEPEATCPE